MGMLFYVGKPRNLPAFPTDFPQCRSWKPHSLYNEDEACVFDVFGDCIKK